jgi:hypothetical protein
MKRVKGYVVGYDSKSGEIVWMVKVKDQDSLHNQQKFPVASLHPGTMLTKPGIDVTFRVQSFGTGQEKVLRAVDVSLGITDPEVKQIVERIPESLTLAVTENGGQFTVWHSECSSMDEARQVFCHGIEEGTVVVGLIEITPELVQKHGGAISDDEAVAGLATVRQMAYLDPIRDVLCAIAAEAFALGQNSKQILKG